MQLVRAKNGPSFFEFESELVSHDAPDLLQAELPRVASLSGIEHLHCARNDSVSLEQPTAGRFNLPYVFDTGFFIFKFEFDDVRGRFAHHSTDESDADAILLGHLALEAVLHSDGMSYAYQVGGGEVTAPSHLPHTALVHIVRLIRGHFLGELL